MGKSPNETAGLYADDPPQVLPTAQDEGLQGAELLTEDAVMTDSSLIWG
ncbi:hypothetical protein EVJ58_g10088 [Rhodofomes roseus]|nr:hypothetical protein EVJ58_g10088 [Rhodofomes roseus]